MSDRPLPDRHALIAGGEFLVFCGYERVYLCKVEPGP
jgi:hypothetical protein